MPKYFDISNLVKAADVHSKELDKFQIAIKNAITNAIDGMDIKTVCINEIESDKFGFTIWGEISNPAVKNNAHLSLNMDGITEIIK
jgi:hypothetical protein